MSCEPSISSLAQGFQTTGPLLYNALQTILTAQSLIAPEVFENFDGEDLERLSAQSYDFIVVGAGTAGSVVAHRLLETGNWTVLLIEAGGNPTLGTEIPALFINNYGTSEDWSFRTEPQKNACLNYKEQRCFWPRGKVLGGTSSINGMYYIKGNKVDFDEWNLETWTSENVKKYFYNLTNDGEDLNSGGGNKAFMNIEHNAKNSPIEDMILRSNEEIGVPILSDINGDIQIGMGTAPTTTRNGQRHSVFNAFLKPLNGNNRLTILKNTFVKQVLIQNGAAVGIKCYSSKNVSKEYEIKAVKEVILSAGTINSAEILLRSGIGPDYLKNNPNVEHKLNLPVGKNLQDHIYAPVMFKIKSDDNSNTLLNIFNSFYQYALDRSGPLADLRPQRVVSFINTTDANSKTPDVQNHFIVVFPNQSNIIDIFGQHRLSDQFYNSFNDLNKNHIIIIVYVTLLQPKSKGEIILDENLQALIKANYLDDNDDIETIVRGMKHALKLKETASFRNSNVELHWVEIDACKGIDKDNDDYLKCIARELTGTLYHAVGTNKMGKYDDSSAVVSDKLKVKSVNNLRVIDVSVMPRIVRGNTMAATLVIAEKGADLIKKDWIG